PQDRARDRRPRGADLRRAGGGDRHAHPAGGLLPPRGAGPAGRRLQHPLPAEPARGALPPRPRPGARRRRPIAGVLSMALKKFNLPDPGEGLTEADLVTWRVAVGDVVKVNDMVVEVETAK